MSIIVEVLVIDTESGSSKVSQSFNCFNMQDATNSSRGLYHEARATTIADQ